MRKIKWIEKGGKSHPGLFAKKAADAGETTREYAQEEKHAGGKLGKEANFALNAMGARNNSARRKAFYTNKRT